MSYDFSSYQFVFLVKIFASWARLTVDFRWIFSCGLNENEGIVRPIPADQAQRRLALQGFIGCPKN